MDIKKELDELPKKMGLKWLSIPVAIFGVLAAGASYNLFAYFQQIGAATGYASGTLTMIKYTVLFGYYLGLLPGLIVNKASATVAFLIAAVFAIVSFPALGWIADNGTDSVLMQILTLVALLFGAMSGALATIASIVTSVKNFSRVTGSLIVVILISYYKIAPYLEFSLRSAFFTEMDLMWYFTLVGVFNFLVYLACAFGMQRIELRDVIENVLKELDKGGLMVFVLFELVFIAAFYICVIQGEMWTIGAILFLAFILINFLAVGLSVFIIYKKAMADKSQFKPGFKIGGKDTEKTFAEYLKEPKYTALVVSAFLVVGLGATFNFNLFQICGSLQKGDQADELLDVFWLAEMTGRFGGGLFNFFSLDKINGYLFAVTGAVLSAVGFGLALLVDPVGGAFLWFAIVFIGLGLGLYWVTVPMILMDDAGEKEFGLNWGLVLFVQFLGMLLFGEFFDWFSDWMGGGAGPCVGGSCVFWQHLIFGFLCLLAAGLAFFGFTKDEDEKGGDKKGGDKKAKKEDKKEKSADKKSKDKSADKKKDRKKSKDKKKKK